MKIESRRMRHVLSVTVVTLGLFIAVFCTAFQFSHYSGSAINLNSYREIPKGDYSYSIDALSEQNYKYDSISGWVVVNGHEVLQYETQVVLYTDDGYAVAVPMKMVERADVTADFNDGNDYDMSGFQGLIRKKISDGKDCKIGFLIDVDHELCLIRTGQVYEVG